MAITYDLITIYAPTPLYKHSLSHKQSKLGVWQTLK